MPRPGTLQLRRSRASTLCFAIRLDDGQEIRGVLLAGRIVDAAPLVQQRVLVVGRVPYRPSGKPLWIDAERLVAAGQEPSVWSRLPAPRNGGLDATEFRKPQGPKSGVAALLGRWPGDETDQ